MGRWSGWAVGGGVASLLLGSVFFTSATAVAAGSATLSIFAGTGAGGPPTVGPARSSDLFEPFGVAVSPNGVVYIADTDNNVVERVGPSGNLTVFAGTGTAGPPTPGMASRSDLNSPEGVAVDSSGNVFIADTYNDEIEKVTPSGSLTIIAGTGSMGAPTPGPATSSELNRPSAVAVGNPGFYIADTANNLIEEVSSEGTLSVVAGTGEPGPPTRGPATRSDLFEPDGVVALPSGGFAIADTFNNVVERVTASGTISLLAGNGQQGEPTAGGATKTSLFEPGGLAITSSGVLYIAEDDGAQLVDVAKGSLSILAGTGTAGPPTTGPPHDSDLFSSDVALGKGVLYLANYGSNQVLKIAAATTG